MSASLHFPKQELRVRFTVGSKDYIRRIDVEGSGPEGAGVTIWHIYPTLDAWLGKRVPDDVNPRSHGEEVLKGFLPAAIQETLEDHPEDFYLANRGETLLAKSVEFDPRTAMVDICLSEYRGDTAIHGIADGATTDAVIARVQSQDAEGLDTGDLPIDQVPPYLRTARLHLEVIVGLEDDRDRIARLVQGRNTSRQVKSWTLADFKGAFDWVRKVLERDGGPFAGRVGYEENAPKPVNVLEILCIMTLFHKEYDSKGKAPTVAYTSKGRMDTRLANEKLLPGYQALAPILEDILWLHDHVYAKFAVAYKEARPRGKPGRRGRGAKRIFPKEERTLPLTGIQASYTVPTGVLYPLLQSLRALVEYDEEGRARWRLDPTEFFDTNAGELMDNLIDQLEVVGSNPNALGKTRPAYTALYDRATVLAYQQEKS